MPFPIQSRTVKWGSEQGRSEAHTGASVTRSRRLAGVRRARSFDARRSGGAAVYQRRVLCRDGRTASHNLVSTRLRPSLVASRRG
jgi:hypothetical protein